MTENRDPVGSLSDDVELLERHISILKTVRENQPVGLIRLSEMTGIPKHRVRYSLKLLEQQGIIHATPDGATVTDRYDGFMNEISRYIDDLAGKIEDPEGHCALHNEGTLDLRMWHCTTISFPDRNVM